MTHTLTDIATDLIDRGVTDTSPTEIKAVLGSLNMRTLSATLCDASFLTEGLIRSLVDLHHAQTSLDSSRAIAEIVKQLDSIEYLIPYAVGNRMDTIFESKKAAQ